MAAVWQGSWCANGIHFEPHEAEQEARRLIHADRDAGLTLRAIAERLIARGIVPRSGRDRWHRQTLANVLKRQVAA